MNNGARPASSVISDAGTGSVASTSIGGNPFHRRFHKAPPMLSYLRHFLPYPRITRSVADRITQAGNLAASAGTQAVSPDVSGGRGAAGILMACDEWSSSAAAAQASRPWHGSSAT